MAESGVELMNRPHKIGEGTRTNLDHPIETSFGKFHARTLFDVGCRPQEVVENGIVMFQSASPDGSVTRDVTIGKTPSEMDTSGKEWDQSGEEGYYLLHMKTTRYDREKPDSAPQVYAQFFYLDREDIQDVTVAKGKFAQLNHNQKRDRAFTIQGKVQQVIALN